MSCPTFDFSDPSKARKTMQRFAAHLKAAVNASPADLLDLTKKVGKILYDNCDAIVAAARGGALMPRIVGYAYEEYIGQLDFFLANIKEDDDRDVGSASHIGPDSTNQRKKNTNQRKEDRIQQNEDSDLRNELSD
ncbi:uncharacterized protein B0H18DRAFT_1217102 [Fomitopsis serialis]|uniref:uncharacterized protein n=1 Tax=Fomitopsis serialis TaxID=139415 RepID=UPI0020074E28|nr:uncharacterized protein B0H18DRAFT_1217102 [Neoantrodia serialis]KAH9912373.1 hypothetical protein B0H18DRAFT_1217102 [Neoantrodia serialis]